MTRLWQAVIAAVLILAAGSAWALGLGQIKVKSQRHQPLVAEIPIISTTPGELQALQARLASPETFRRIGLAPPSGITTDLQFSLGSDAKGRPVIRVTTVKPVEQAVLNFLIEVDWGQGRLVREYSALIDVPGSTATPAPVAVQTPQTPEPNVVQRPAPLAQPTDTVPSTQTSTPVPATPVPATPVPSPVVAAAEPAPEPAPLSTAIAPSPAAPEEAPQPAATPAPTAVPLDTPASPASYGVKRGDTLSGIARGLTDYRAYSLDQTMMALLQANPSAFTDRNVNRLLSGSVLRLPDQSEVAQLDAAAAALAVRAQVRQWRGATHPVAQPSVATKATAEPKPAVAKSTKAPSKATSKPTRALRLGKTAMAAAPQLGLPLKNAGEGARLEIVPAAAAGKAKGATTGTSAGGAGSMLQQEVRRRDEDIAAKSAEIGELKERVAALEKLKDDQQKLISMKDSELAAAQARLAAANEATTKAQVPATTKATEATTAQPPKQADAGSHMMPYVWGGIAVVVLALLAWLLAAKRKPVEPPRRRAFDSEALAASFAQPSRTPSDSEARATDTPEPATPPSVTPPQPAASAAETPQWHSARVKTEAPPSTPTPAPTSPAPVADVDAPESEVVIPPEATIEQRFKLVRAFLDMGDQHSAREVLIELMQEEDEAASSQAATMLSRLFN